MSNFEHLDVSSHHAEHAGAAAATEAANRLRDDSLSGPKSVEVQAKMTADGFERANRETANDLYSAIRFNDIESMQRALERMIVGPGSQSIILKDVNSRLRQDGSETQIVPGLRDPESNSKGNFNFYLMTSYKKFEIPVKIDPDMLDIMY